MREVSPATQLSRRSLLRGAAGFAAATLTGTAAGAVPATDSLGQRAAAKNLVYGAATHTRLLEQDDEFARVFAEECAVLVPEWEAKWGPLRPTPDVFEFGALDRLVAWAEAHGMMFRGHALLWHESNPPWLGEQLLPENAGDLLAQHISTVMERYAGRIQSWDVVNEPIWLKDGRSDGLRESLWLDALGPDYIAEAFHAARAADPGAKLFLNEYGLDYSTNADETKRSAVLRLLERLRSQEVPVDGLGIQAHLAAGKPFSATVFRRFLCEVAELGLEIYVTELDVGDQALPADVALRDHETAEHARRYLEAALDERATRMVVTWGLSDRYTWVNETENVKRKDGIPGRPLPYDDALAPKPMRQALADAFDRTLPR